MKRLAIYCIICVLTQYIAAVGVTEVKNLVLWLKGLTQTFILLLVQWGHTMEKQNRFNVRFDEKQNREFSGTRAWKGSGGIYNFTGSTRIMGNGFGVYK